MTTTILDTHEKHKPRPWWRKAPGPTALELAAADMMEAERNLLEHLNKQEYHAAMSAMLRKRVERLRSDIERLSRNPDQQPKE